MACTIKEKQNSKQAGYRRGGKEDVSAGLWGRHGETEQLQAETDLFDATQSQSSGVYTGCMGGN